MTTTKFFGSFFLYWCADRVTHRYVIIYISIFFSVKFKLTFSNALFSLQWNKKMNKTMRILMLTSILLLTKSSKRFLNQIHFFWINFNTIFSVDVKGPSYCVRFPCIHKLFNNMSLHGPFFKMHLKFETKDMDEGQIYPKPFRFNISTTNECEE